MRPLTVMVMGVVCGAGNGGGDRRGGGGDRGTRKTLADGGKKTVWKPLFPSPFTRRFPANENLDTSSLSCIRDD